MSTPLVHISATDGHRASYRDLFVRLLNGEPSTGPIRNGRFWKLVHAQEVVFATIDDDYIGFSVVAVLRALQRKPTTGLFLRPLQCFRAERQIIYTMKRHVFRWLCKLPGLRLLSIIPHDIHPELAHVSHDWIYDPQMYDLWVEGPPNLPDTNLSQKVQRLRDNRKVVVYIGRKNRIKGFPEFVAEAHINRDTTLYVAAGLIDKEYVCDAKRLCDMGMIIENRLLTDDEVLSLYKVADFAWCKYAPDYDQASGVFGYALQCGVNPIIRQGSVISHMNEMVTRQRSETGDLQLFDYMREFSLNKLRFSRGHPKREMSDLKEP